MKERFSLKFILGIVLLILFVAPLNLVLAASDPNDSQGCKEPSLFKRMPGFHIYNCRELDFNHFDFPIQWTAGVHLRFDICSFSPFQ